MRAEGPRDPVRNASDAVFLEPLLHFLPAILGRPFAVARAIIGMEGVRRVGIDDELGCVDVAACGAGDSAFGCRQMLGNVWEWTASDFLPYPGFAPDDYADYSQPWFGTRKVLRGGAWATRGRLITSAYRNFFTGERRDVFAGFRSAAL